jgi:uncharacterized repeat protein (TIGR03803 family)
VTVAAKAGGTSPAWRRTWRWLSHSSQIWATHFVRINPAQRTTKGAVISVESTCKMAARTPKKAEKEVAPGGYKTRVSHPSAFDCQINHNGPPKPIRKVLMKISGLDSPRSLLLQRLLLAAVGLALAGATNAGVVSQGISPLYSFTGLKDGGNPEAGLIQAGDGNLYGTTESGGSNGFGTVFQISTGGLLNPLHLFTNGDGAYPYAGLIQASDGNLYGTTQGGGTDNGGTFFRISTNGAFAALYSFNGANGYSPVASLVQAGDGSLYGTTQYGGAYGNGTV